MHPAFGKLRRTMCCTGVAALTLDFSQHHFYMVRKLYIGGTTLECVGCFKLKVPNSWLLSFFGACCVRESEHVRVISG
jgi:hypothetical protein